MTFVGVRTRDQAWQLVLAALVGAALIVAAVVALSRTGGRDSLGTVGVIVQDGDGVSEVVAGPASGNDQARLGGAERDTGPAAVPGDRSTTTERDRRSTTTAETKPSTTDHTKPSTTAETKPSTTDKPTTTDHTRPSTTDHTKPSTTDHTRPSTTDHTKPSTTDHTRPSTTDHTKPSTTDHTKPSTTGPTVTRPTSTVPTVTRPTITVPSTVTITVIEPDHNITPRDLARARRRWARSGVDSYRMIVQRSCFCPPAWLGPFEVLVRDGRVRVTRLDDRAEVPDEFQGKALTVDGLFELVEEAFRADGLKVTFNSDFGYPAEIHIDYLRFAVDDELSVTVRDFQPLREADGGRPRDTP